METALGGLAVDRLMLRSEQVIILTVNDVPALPIPWTFRVVGSVVQDVAGLRVQVLHVATAIGLGVCHRVFSPNY